VALGAYWIIKPGGPRYTREKKAGAGRAAVNIDGDKRATLGHSVEHRHACAICASRWLPAAFGWPAASDREGRGAARIETANGVVARALVSSSSGIMGRRHRLRAL